jgi:regulator of replication initiation timing
VKERPLQLNIINLHQPQVNAREQQKKELDVKTEQKVQVVDVTTINNKIIKSYEQEFIVCNRYKYGRSDRF